MKGGKKKQHCDKISKSGALFQMTKVRSLDNQFKFFGVDFQALNDIVERQAF